MIIVIGAGPVGLYACLRLAIKFPLETISIFEKRGHLPYSRKQMLVLEKGFCKKLPVDLFDKIIENKSCYITS